MKKLDYKTLYVLWAAMFALTAVLGFVFPAAEGSGLRLALLLISVLFFLPPWLILLKAKSEGRKHHAHLVRWLAVASLALTVALLCLNLISPLWSEAVGNALNAALIVVSAPMVCSNSYAVPLFLWGTLLAGSFTGK